MSPNRAIQIDDEGYFMSNGLRVSDEDYARHLFENLEVKDRGFLTNFSGQDVIVEAFDVPLILKHLEPGKESWSAQAPYGFNVQFSLDTLRLDEWDRFHGVTKNNLPFVFSRQAQMEFFDACDEFDDDSVIINGKRIKTKPVLPDIDDVDQSEFWGERYRAWTSNGDKPGWDLGEAHPAISDILPQLKLNRSRIAVLGCGAGHDAAAFARQGHFVTAFDFSEDALKMARANYTNVTGLEFVKANALNMPNQYHGQFDVVFEHTLYCAINPAKRNDLVKSWRKLLHEQGHLLAIFFLLDYTDGPPFGATEWELRERMKSSFEPLYWTRWKASPPSRIGKELVVYSRKSSTL